MNTNTIAYSSITAFSHYFRECCGERLMITPCCEVEVCVLCEDGCESCGAEIDWSK